MSTIIIDSKKVIIALNYRLVIVISDWRDFNSVKIDNSRARTDYHVKAVKRHASTSVMNILL